MNRLVRQTKYPKRRTIHFDDCKSPLKAGPSIGVLYAAHNSDDKTHNYEPHLRNDEVIRTSNRAY